MFILKLLVKIILLPLFLAICFVRTWVEVLSKIGCVILGLFYLLMLAVIITLACQHLWGCVAISVAVSFAGFIVTFATMAVGMALDGISDKIGEILAS